MRICAVPLRSVVVAVAALALPLALAGCGGYPPWTMKSSPDAIALRWYPHTTPSMLAGQIAELHCARSGKSAEMVVNNRDGSAEYAEFHCR